ncbi:LacI family DNA-binding transcriptional regulator [Salinicoccus sp. ID82-1]|uniref:LacI family DNA-binding transcriptional regulator n=1 Tax=Salinicoccus sp. ID82-1 TaxID=2820269 RepID=UPI001F2FC39D|nr:LacI family DNA-binding transcriptional regulator [Salinicoccus sp. ID82-1]MCG1010647.1 LacI family DNA-binding transcriptional regulator [Salinicoccus sp. ID82-1]
MKKVTIRDVAEHAEVSVGTVSKVINNKGYISKQARQVVLESIQELGYSVNANARSLKTSKSNKIAVLISDISNPYLMSIAKDVEEMIRSLDSHMILLSHSDDPEIERSSLKVIMEQQVDALVIIPTGQNKDMIEAIQNMSIPVIAIDRQVDGVATDLIVDDNFYGSYECIKYLSSLGHKRIGIIYGHERNSIGRERLYGAIEAIKEYNLDEETSLLQEADFKENFAYRATIELLMHPNPPTAIYSCNNTMTKGVLKALRDQDKQIPTDISVIAFGDSEQWELIEPKLTLMTQPMKRIGMESSILLKNRLVLTENYELQHKVMKPLLIEGKSCKSIK